MNENHENDRQDEESEEDFASLLEESLQGSSQRRLEPGQKMPARILAITADWVFLDVGQKGEGVLDKKELLDEEGRLTVEEGNQLEVFFLSRAGGELRFTTRISGAAGRNELEEAWKNGIPVDGRVEKEIKGGFEIRLGGNMRAFCPYSQMGLRRTESVEEWLGQNLSFRISQFAEGGRNIVVSHRALLEEERERQREKLRHTLQEGTTVLGTVTSLRDFGAFVDIGGIEGLLPISEVAWGRVEDLSEVLHVGQEVELVVKSLDWDANKISFSRKETLSDPWQQAAAKYREGSVHQGRISRLAPFGAFVMLEEGIDGLVHISQLGEGKRIHHPREAVQEGDTLQVRVEKIDPEARRISLAPVSGEQHNSREDLSPYMKQRDESQMGTLGDLLKQKMEKKKRKKT